jgi:hypothetical protein
MLQRNWRDETFFDVINVALGGFLFLSPWLFGFSSDLARHTSWMAGATISILALFAIIEFFESGEWANLIIGLWVAVCGWILGFGTDTAAKHVHLVVGLSVAALAAAELWRAHAAPRDSG